MKITLYIACLAVLLACAKNPSPKEVDRKLTEGSWFVTEFIDNDQSILKKYQEVSFGFSAGGEVLSTSDSSATGTWSLGNDKKPTILYLNFPEETDSLHILTDDWVVYRLTKNECVLKRTKETGFNYEASLDQLKLTKK